ncbi:Thioesterase/thiol ester dehydrase-isomerase [Phellopilus nigrolimitatus]|nr:Thioesterase/thiol ester dehydrase-isomerase [Phellopilus nigrolimitatus]
MICLRRLSNLSRRPPLSARPRCLPSSPSRRYTVQHADRHPNPRRTKSFRALAAALASSCAAFTLGALYPPNAATLLAPRIAPPPPDPDHPAAKAYVAELEDTLQALPILKALRAAPDADTWYETRPYVNVPEERAANSMTAGALRGPGRLALPPLLRVKRDESECVVVTHFGRGLCGHDGIVHGGLIATVLDETLGRLSIMNFPEKVAVTATLTVDYKAPTRADQFVVVRARLVELKGRKAYVEGSVEDVHGTVLATAKALFIQPKYAKLLDTTAIRKALGEPPAVAAATLTGGDPAPVPADPAIETKTKK